MSCLMPSKNSSLLFDNSTKFIPVKANKPAFLNHGAVKLTGVGASSVNVNVTLFYYIYEFYMLFMS